jgi:hypothetical protein
MRWLCNLYDLWSFPFTYLFYLTKNKCRFKQKHSCFCNRPGIILDLVCHISNCPKGKWRY